MLRLEQQDSGFTIYLGDLVLAQHSMKSAMLRVGIGKATDVPAHLGKEAEAQESFSLVYHKVMDSQDGAFTLALSNDPSFQEEVRLQYDGRGSSLSMESSFPSQYFNRYWLILQRQAGEHLYGGGHQSYHFNLKGNSHGIYLYDEYFSKQERSLPLALAKMPSFVSSYGYAMVVQESSRLVLSLVEEEVMELEIWGKPHSFIWLTGASIKEVLMKQSSYYGRSLPMAQWPFEQVIAGFRGPMKRVQQGIHLLEQEGIKVGGIWLQDWAHACLPTFGPAFDWHWIFAANLRKSMMEKVQDAAAQGYPVAAYMNGFLPEGSVLFYEADKLGFLLNTKNMELYFHPYQEFNLAMVDLSNEAAFAWFAQVVAHQVLEVGIKLLVIDDGSHLPHDALLSDGSLSSAWAVLWPELLGRVCQEAKQLAGKAAQDVVILSTAAWGYSMALVHGVVLAREYVVAGPNFSLAPLCTALLSGSMSGYGVQVTLVGYSVGKAATRELIIRHAELALLSPLFWMQEADARYQAFRYYEDSQVIGLLKPLISLYLELSTYRKKVANEAFELGLPMIRPLFLYDESDAMTYSIEDQLMLGDSLMIAPVLHDNQVQRSVYFPVGRWLHFFSDLEVTGPLWQECAAPLGQPLAFYLASSPDQELFGVAKEQMSSRIS
jgi:sulfoquinovosidase